jgi:hypothetical protein
MKRHFCSPQLGWQFYADFSESVKIRNDAGLQQIIFHVNQATTGKEGLLKRNLAHKMRNPSRGPVFNWLKGYAHLEAQREPLAGTSIPAQNNKQGRKK